MASWNVRTLRDTRVRKTAIVADELMRLRVDVAALSETRLADQGQISEKGFTFFWSGMMRVFPVGMEYVLPWQSILLDYVTGQYLSVTG